jgi:hypothetical protein
MVHPPIWVLIFILVSLIAITFSMPFVIKLMEWWSNKVDKWCDK